MTLRGSRCAACGIAVALAVLNLFATISASAGDTRVDKVVVEKSARKMYLFSGEALVRVYHVALGGSPEGDKQRRGDERTPEGVYTLDFKNTDSAFYKSIHISYPNLEDLRDARRLGVDPGGQIMIHGQKNGYSVLASETQKLDWTDGCIAVTDYEMDEIWRLVSVGTTIEIVP